MTRLQRIAAALFTAAAMVAGAAQAEPALWKVTHGQATAYLYGSVHLLKHDAVWDTPKVEAALSQAKELWLEIKDVDDPAAMRPLVAKLGVDPTHPLSGQLDAAYQEKLKKALKSVGYPETALEPMRPWLAALTLNLAPLQRGGYDPEAGVDRLLKAAAKAKKDAPPPPRPGKSAPTPPAAKAKAPMPHQTRPAWTPSSKPRASSR